MPWLRSSLRTKGMPYEPVGAGSSLSAEPVVDALTICLEIPSGSLTELDGGAE